MGEKGWQSEHSYNFRVKREGLNYVVRNDLGRRVYSSGYASLAIQEAYNRLTAARLTDEYQETVLLKGYIELDDTVLVPAWSKTLVAGTVYLMDNVNKTMFQNLHHGVGDDPYIAFYGVGGYGKLDGNRTKQTAGHVLSIEGASGHECDRAMITDLHLRQAEDIALRLVYCPDSKVIGNTLVSNTDQDIYIDHTSTTRFIGNYLGSVATNNLYINYSNMCTFLGNRYDVALEHSILLYGGYGHIFSGETMRSTTTHPKAAHNTWDMIFLRNTTSIHDCVIDEITMMLPDSGNQVRYGVNEEGANVDENIITSIVARSCATNAVHVHSTTGVSLSDNIIGGVTTF